VHVEFNIENLPMVCICLKLMWKLVTRIWLQSSVIPVCGLNAYYASKLCNGRRIDVFNTFMFFFSHFVTIILLCLLFADVPEGSFIVREHTPMSNLFSCLWFNEVERFTPRDQLSFAYTYQKLTRMNPDTPFNLHMFKVRFMFQ